MTDIVEHLREHGWSVATEAADQIERLREEVRHLRIDNARLRDEAYLRYWTAPAVSSTESKTP